MTTITSELGVETQVLKIPARLVRTGDILLQGDLSGSGSVHSNIISDAEFSDDMKFVTISFDLGERIVFPRNNIVTVVSTTAEQIHVIDIDRHLVLSNLNLGL